MSIKLIKYAHLIIILSISMLKTIYYTRKL